MKLAFIYSRTRISGRLTKFWTGSYCYHVGFTDGRHFWDMHLIRRRRQWGGYDPAKVVLVDCPVPVSREYLEKKLETDNAWYGVLDYMLFALRPLHHFFGKSTRNMGGVICSEMVANDLKANGWGKEFSEVPSPADLELAILGRKNAIN